MDLAIDQISTRSRWSLSGGLAELGIAPVQQMATDTDHLRQRRNGRIVTENGKLDAVHGRWWPHLGDMLNVLWDTHARSFAQDRCELYFHQPLGSPGFLTLSYIRSGPRTTLSTLYAATLVLDEIARLKQANAIVAHVTNDRITDRLLTRWGWQQHCLDWSGRHFIKRFYGKYPAIKTCWRDRLGMLRIDSASPSQEKAEI